MWGSNPRLSSLKQHLLRLFRKQPTVADTSRVCVWTERWGCSGRAEQTDSAVTGREESGVPAAEQRIYLTPHAELPRPPPRSPPGLEQVLTGGIGRVFPKLCIIRGQLRARAWQLSRNADAQETLEHGELQHHLFFFIAVRGARRAARCGDTRAPRRAARCAQHGLLPRSRDATARAAENE